MRSRFTFMVLLVLVVLASVAFGQKLNSEEVHLWEDICFANLEKHPDPNRWAVGDTMLIPPAFFGRWEYVIVNSDIAQHPWVVTKNLNDGVIQSRELMPTPNTVTNKPGEKRSLLDRYTDWENRFWHSATWQRIAEMVVLLVLVASLCGLLYWLYRQYKQRQQEADQPQPPFIEPERVPDFNTATSQDAAPVVAEALGRVYGPIEILGNVERGRLNGTFTIFYSDGSHRSETYHDEPGFKARVRLGNGNEVTAYGRWACFNLVRGAENVDASRVTFTAEGTDRHYVVKGVSEAEADVIGRSIAANGTTAAEPTTAEPAAAEADTAATAPTVPVAPEDMVGEITEIQVSKGHVTFKGKMPMTPKIIRELTELLVK